ncbi:ComEA family DNA-binding protein [Mycetocola zhujimingii]|uniref:Helix-hairpin-helix domain-containing protein n=1 Tax=Mycetocola zhujimingii TaxID=2079792 RepID=A0A2U1TBX0_9MICO|nr:helix-hairpin-helix domain-containing protein [Mycetocola zhujimingii]PWC06374.1 hypothetical protein DF223_12285 [Mycetocola zhujimingii]
MAQARKRGRRAAPSTEENEPSRRWMLGASSWLLLLLAPAGALAWIGFGVLALIGRKRSWQIAAVVYGVAALVVHIPDGAAGDVARGGLSLVALLHGLIVNEAWLRLLWSRRAAGLTVVGRPRVAKKGRSSTATRESEAMPEEAERLLGEMGTSKADYVDESAPAAAAPPAGRKRRTRAKRGTAATRSRTDAAARDSEVSGPSAGRSAPLQVAEDEVDQVDVNTANQRALAKLPGMDRDRARTVVADRTRRGGFASLDDFASSAGLQPHEMVRLRDVAFCSPRARAPRTFGRRVDY